jgi:hypothetical protein
MAKPTQKSSEIAELIRCADAARFQIGQAHHRLKQKLDIPLRIRDSLKSSPLKWLTGSLATGFVGSFLFRSRKPRKDEAKKSRGWIMSSLSMAFNLAKPALKIYGAKILQDYLQHQLARRAAAQHEAQRPPY